MRDWPQWYCQVCGEADGANAEHCGDCADYIADTLPRPSEDEFHSQLRAEGIEVTATEHTPTWAEMLRALGFNTVEEAEEYARHLKEKP
jgi:hypothetical protein